MRLLVDPRGTGDARAGRPRPSGGGKLPCVNSVGYFETIDADECRRLIGDADVGRVAWVSPTGGLQVLPVNYALLGDVIVFRVAHGSVLEELSHPVAVAFQVDDLDASTATGWAVLVQGESRAWDGEVPVAQPWAPGRREVAVAIEARSWSGRSVSAEEA